MTPFKWISLNVSEQGLLSWLHLDGFCWHFHNRACFVEMIEMGGYNPILTSKLFILFIILTPFRWISLKCVEQSLYCWDDLNEGSHLIFNSKLYVLFNILTPCRWFFWNFQNMACFVEMIEMRCHNPVLTSKLYVLFNILKPVEFLSAVP